MFYEINNCLLDESQINAIEDDSDSILVCAGAGSGKSLTILGKVKYLIERKNYREDEILCISFTNESSLSLYNKLKNIGYTIDVFTFHKLGLNILNNDNFSIIDDNYLDYIINEYFESYIKYNKKEYDSLKRLFFTNKEVSLYELSKLKTTISTFIRLLKSSGKDIVYLYNIYKKSIFEEKKILKYIIEIYLLYTNELESMNKIDFDDMIIKATDNVENRCLKYKYIIIDEFQDTSFLRYKLINKIIEFNKAKVFVVGDDYQSIYRFTGCDLDIFINFNKYFYNAKRYDLNFTYRNSNELIYVSSSFIMKNKFQLKKKIISIKNRDKPIIIVKNRSVYDVINLINDNDILIIGRNNNDIKDIDWDNKLTIHKSKGLEAKNVILVNSDNIPSTIKEEKILRHVLSNKEYIPYEEERRLFYVALTRTKECIYIMVNKKMSPFVKELISNYKDYINFFS